MLNGDVERIVRAALERDSVVNLRRSPIEIKQKDGILTLTGEVENIIEKRRALQIARKVSGTQKIADRLRLKLAQPQEDQELEQSVVKHLAADSVFANFLIRSGPAEPERDTDWISVRAKDGVVRLEGRANSLSHRRLAEVVAWWVRGCADVENLIHVYPDERDNDYEISDAIRLILDKDPSIDAQQINIQTSDHEVRLTGTVPSEETRRIVAYDCWYIPGVHDVHNELTVRRR